LSVRDVVPRDECSNHSIGGGQRQNICILPQGLTAQPSGNPLLAPWLVRQLEAQMVILGIVLIVLGLLVASLKALLIIGVILLVVGLVLNIAPVGGTRRRFY
jgi:hypothetical protein